MIDFNIDGRKKIDPPAGAMGGCPMSIKAATCRMIIANFQETGESNHGLAGTTLWVILAYCRQANIPFLLEARPNYGYHVKRLYGDPT